MDTREVGRQLLGPFFEEVLQRLHLYMRPTDQGVRRLFVARAGVRLQKMYEVFCEAKGLTPAATEVLWTSRLMATKALFGLDDDLFYESVFKEFQGKSIGNLAAGLSRHEKNPWEVVGSLASQPVETLRGHVESGDLPTLRKRLEESANACRSYLEQMLCSEDQTFLIDSGWHGTIHRLLTPMESAPITSLYVCRVRRQGEPAPPTHHLVGLAVEADDYDDTLPESSLLYHRHLIEAPLEPPTPSIERVSLSPSGEFTFPEAEGCEALDPDSPSDVAYQGILDYLESGADRGPTAVQASYVLAVSRLANAILFPTLEDAHVLDMGFRSSDFGKTSGAPVLLDPKSRWEGDNAEVRTQDALWPQGQAALEFGSAAGAVHRKLAGRDVARDYFHPWRGGDTECETRGSVAVITRTKDRAVLLRRAAESVAAQTYRNFKWVVVNDGGSLEAVESIIRASRVPRSQITIVSNGFSVGMEAASNLGASNSQSDYMTIHDDDDSWSPDFLMRTVGFLHADTTGYSGVITHTTRVSEEIVGENVLVRDRQPYNQWIQNVSLAEMSASNMFAPIAFVFSRSIYDEVGGYREDLPVLGDWDFNLRVLAKSDIGVIPEALANYHHRDVGTSTTYGNSVSAGRSTHVEYDAVVRNRMLRSLGDDPLGDLARTGYMLRVLRDEIRKVDLSIQSLGSTQTYRNHRPGSVGQLDESETLLHPLRDADILWAVGHAVARRSRERHSVLSRILRRMRHGAPTAADWLDLLDEASNGELTNIPAPPDFDEDRYLRLNPDVAQAVRGRMNPVTSGWEHYLTNGRSEGRSRPVRKP